MYALEVLRGRSDCSISVRFGISSANFILRRLQNTNENGLTLPAYPIRMSELAMPTERPTIIFDVLDKSVAILRGSDFVTLPGPFVSQAEGMASAREECIKRGWIPRSEHSETHR